MVQYRNNKKTSSSANKTSKGARFHRRSKTSSFSHFQGVIAAPWHKKRGLSFSAPSCFNQSFISSMWGEKGLWEAATSPEGACAKGQMLCHGTSFAETNNGKKKRRKTRRLWFLCPFWAPLRLRAMEKSPELCRGSWGS